MASIISVGLALTLKVLLFIAGLAFLGFLLLTPNEVALDTTCHPQGSLNKLRARVWGERFWRSQSSHIDEELQAIRSMPKLRSFVDSVTIAIRTRTDSSIDSIYSTIPGLPTKVRRTTAESLREVSDSLDLIEMRGRMDSVLVQRVAFLVGCSNQISDHISK